MRNFRTNEVIFFLRGPLGRREAPGTHCRSGTEELLPRGLGEGEGAKIAGDRWNSAGPAVVYAAESISLAVLGNLAHMPRQDFATGCICIAATLPDRIKMLSESPLRRPIGLHELSPQFLGYWVDWLLV